MIAEPSVKINLGIDVLRKRPDGYHDIETLFVPYHELHDTLEIVKADDYPRTLSALMSRYSPSSGQIAQAVSEDAKVMITIARKEGVDWSPLDDLTVKAYMEMAKDHDLGPVKIYLEKKSPVGAGLGGGSSDAASAIDSKNLFCSGKSPHILVWSFDFPAECIHDFPSDDATPIDNCFNAPP